MPVDQNKETRALFLPLVALGCEATACGVGSLQHFLGVFCSIEWVSLICNSSAMATVQWQVPHQKLPILHTSYFKLTMQ